MKDILKNKKMLYAMILGIVFLISTGTLSLRPEVTVSSTGDGSYTNPYVVE